MARAILVLDNDAARRQVHAFGMRCVGFDVCEAADIPDAWAQIERQCPDLILVVASALEQTIQQLVRDLRLDLRTARLPVLALLESGESVGTSPAMKSGLDEVLSFPVSPDALVSRINARLEDSAGGAHVSEEVTGLQLDNEVGILSRGDRSVLIGPMERRLLEVFLMHPDQLIARQVLAYRIWGSKASSVGRIVDINVCRLRGVLRELHCEGLLQTVRRKGYRFAVHVQPAARVTPRGVRREIPVPRSMVKNKNQSRTRDLSTGVDQ